MLHICLVNWLVSNENIDWLGFTNCSGAVSSFAVAVHYMQNENCLESNNFNRKDNVFLPITEFIHLWLLQVVLVLFA
jgi:hypothetical protein